MHGTHIAMTGLFQPVPMPAAQAAERTTSAKDSFGWTWEKAINAGSATVQPTKKDGSTPRKPEVIVDQDDKPEDAVDLVKAAEDEAREPHEKRPAIAAQAPKAFVEAQPQKKLASAGDKQTPADTKKHKVQDDADVEAGDQPRVPAEKSVALGVPVATAPVVAQSLLAPPGFKSDGKRLGKAESSPSTRSTPNVATTENASKAAEASPVAKDKRAADVEGSKALPIADVKAKTSDASAESAALNHAKVIAAKTFDANAESLAPNHNQTMVANIIEVNGSTGAGVAGQAIASTMATPLPHKTTGLPVAADLQNNATTTGADVNPAHVLAGGPGQLEVGVLDGTHGWLKIRAELGTDGSVNALLTSNATSHEELRESVPALSGYLISESVNVGKIAVHRAPEGSAAGGDMTNANSGSDSSDGGAASPNQGGGRSASPSTNSFLSANAYASMPQDMDSSMDGISPAVFGGAGAGFNGNGMGSWLSVTV
jgi:hypothetical protein